MATRTNALALVEAQKAKFRASGLSGEKAWEMLPEGGEEDARELVSGTISTAELRRRGHPFARKTRLAGYVGTLNKASDRNQLRRAAGKGTAPLLPINRQSGRLLGSIERVEMRGAGARQVQSVGFGASAGRSRFVVSPTGTDRMVARGFWNELKKRWRRRNLAFREVYVRGQRRAMS
jgi:hypothetical protein